jgi:parallel beta-helix repeat protein
LSVEEKTLRRRENSLVSGVFTASLLLAAFGVAFNAPLVYADGTIYIRADGSIDPPATPIIEVDNVTYIFVGNINGSIVVQRNGIIVDGCGYTLQGPGNGTGFPLSGMTNVTIRNTTITNFTYGIWLDYSDNNTLSGNNVTANNWAGIELDFHSGNNTLCGNNVTANNWAGIYLLSNSGNNTLSGNNAANNWAGIYLQSDSGNNTLCGNNVSANNFAGIYLQSSSDNTLSGNNAANNWAGIYLLSDSGNNTLCGNNAANNEYGIYLDNSGNNNLSGNNVAANNQYGIYLYSSSGNRIFHNNFLYNTQQTYVSNSNNIWDNGYPSGGNCWSDYLTKYPNAAENDSSGVWNTSYVIDANNVDNYPLTEQIIVPEFLSQVIPLLLMLTTVAAVIISRMGHPKRAR